MAMTGNPCRTCNGKGGAYSAPDAKWRWCSDCKGAGAREGAFALDGAVEGAGVGIRHDSDPRRLFGD